MRRKFNQPDPEMTHDWIIDKGISIPVPLPRAENKQKHVGLQSTEDFGSPILCL